MGARSAAMGYASAILRDETSMFNNPGAILTNGPSAFFAYEASALLPGANRMAAGMLLPAAGGIAGLGLFRFGDDLYNEQIARMSYGNQLGLASLGIRVNYVQYHADGYENKNAITLDFGGLAQITNEISVGACIINLNQAEIAPGEKLPIRLVAGIGFRIEKNFILTTEINKDVNFGATWHTGFEYNFRERLFFRSGYSLNPNAIHAGLGAKIKRLSVDYALVFNPILGDIHQASAILRFNKASSK